MSTRLPCLLAQRRRLPPGDLEVPGDGCRRGAPRRAAGAECPAQGHALVGQLCRRVPHPLSGHRQRLGPECFTREVPGLQERYRQIAAHLEQARLPFTVDFRYLEQGVRPRPVVSGVEDAAGSKGSRSTSSWRNTWNGRQNLRHCSWICG